MQDLVAGPRLHLSEQQVTDSLAWNGSTMLRWHVDTLNTTTLDPTGIDIEVVSGSVRWQWRAEPDAGGSPVSAVVRRTGNLRIRHWPGFNPLSVLYRPVVEMRGPDGEWVPWHLGVFTATLPPYHYEGYSDRDGAVVWRDLPLADRSHLWQSDSPPDAVMVESGVDVHQWVRDDLALRFGVFNVGGVEGSQSAETDYVFDGGTPYLEIYNTLLGAAGNEPLHADADGEPRSRPLEDPQTREAEHDYAYATTVVAAADVEAVNPELPNVLRFVARRAPSLAEEGNGIRTVTNDNTGPASIQQRGGRRVLQRVEVDAQTQEELDAQARAWAPFYFAGGGLRYVGDVGLNPRHDDSDVVFLEKPALGISGTWVVTGWDIQLGAVESMRTMRLELEQLTGTAFVALQPPPTGTFGTFMFGTLPFGAGAGGIVVAPPPPPPASTWANLLTAEQSDLEGTL